MGLLAVGKLNPLAEFKLIIIKSRSPGESSSPFRSDQSFISRAISSVTSRDHPSEVLKQTMRTGLLYWPEIRFRIGWLVRFSFVYFAIGTAIFRSHRGPRTHPHQIQALWRATHNRYSLQGLWS